MIRVNQTRLMDALTDLESEIYRASALHPGNRMLFPALVEQIGEVAQAIQEGEADQARLECLHVACVAIRMYMQDLPYFEQLSAKSVDKIAENS